LIVLAEVFMSQTCGVSFTHFCTVPPPSTLIATAAPTPPIVAGFVTAAPWNFGFRAISWRRNSLLSAPTTGTYGLPAVLNAFTTV
jgi:hypothetical protein